MLPNSLTSPCQPGFPPSDSLAWIRGRGGGVGGRGSEGAAENCLWRGGGEKRGEQKGHLGAAGGDLGVRRGEVVNGGGGSGRGKEGRESGGRKGRRRLALSR